MASKKSLSRELIPEPLLAAHPATKKYVDDRVSPARYWTITSVINTNAPSFAPTVEAAPPGNAFQYLGARPSDLVNVQGSGAYGSKWKNGGTATSATAAWGVQFRVPKSRYVEFLIAPVGSDASIRIFVDGVENSVAPMVFPSFAANVFNTVKIDLGPEASRPNLNPVIRLDLSANMLLGKVWAEQGSTITPAVNKGLRYVFHGDSLTQGETQNTGGELGSYVGYMSKYLDTADIWNSGVRGSGPNTAAGGGGNFMTRATTDVANTAADVVVVSGFFNDRSAGRTPAQIAADLGTTVDTILAMPNKPQVIVFGSPDPGAGSNATEWATFDSAIQSAMQTRRVPYVSQSTGQVWMDNGVVVGTFGPWIVPNMPTWFTGNDGLHPTDQGHAYKAARYAEAIAIIQKTYADRRRLREWSTEMVLNSSALASGYNDAGGGIQVNNPATANGIVLDSIAFRLGGDPDTSPVVGGTGDLTIQYYIGTPTAVTSLLATATLAAGGHDLVTTLAVPVQCLHNSVLRAKITLGSATVAVPCYVQFRGRAL